jgi:succinylarginine dihydrolase
MNSANQLIEIQIDRLVGPTHHFGGLGVGNLASAKHAGEVSNPKAAALQGLEKMMLVQSLGVPQFVLPPQPRPNLTWLQQLGFDDMRDAYRQSPDLFSAAMSCSAMWTANAATVTPAIDSRSSVATATIANLSASLHRSLEPAQTEMDLRSILPPSIRVQQAIPGGAAMRDEGAANHMRLSVADGPAIHLFVYGDGSPAPKKHWPRQTRAACEAIARRHQLIRGNTFFLKQHPDAIDAGAFHNDVVAMSHGHLLIHHELAFEDNAKFAAIENRSQQLAGRDLNRIEVTDSQLPLDHAVKTYLFNSQILSTASREIAAPVMICPSQVEQHSSAKSLVSSWVQQGIFSQVKYVDLDQSMAGGGGPACLRLRFPMTSDEVNRMGASSRLTEAKYHQLHQIICAGYPESLTLAQLTDSELIREVDAVTQRLRAKLAIS